MVRGEARRIIEEAGAGDIVEAEPEAIASLSDRLAADRRRIRGRDVWARLDQ